MDVLTTYMSVPCIYDNDISVHHVSTVLSEARRGWDWRELLTAEDFPPNSTATFFIEIEKQILQFIWTWKGF